MAQTPNLKGYDATVSGEGLGVTPHASGVDMPAYIGQGEEKLGAGLKDTADALQLLDNAQASARVRDNIFKDDMNLNQMYLDAHKNMPEEGIGFTDGLIKSMSDYRDKAIANEPNQLAKNHYTTMLNGVINGYVRQAGNAEFHQFQSYKVNSYDNNITAASNLAFTDPDPGRTLERWQRYEKSVDDDADLQPGSRPMLKNRYWNKVMQPFLDGFTVKYSDQATDLINKIRGAKPASLQPSAPGQAPASSAPPDFADGIPTLEASPDQNGRPQISPKGAVGRYQVLASGTKSGPGALDAWNQENPKEQYSNADLQTPEVGDKIGKWYANKMLGIFGNPVDAAGAYNAGPGRIQAWIGAGRPGTGAKALPAETVGYMIRAQRLFGSQQTTPITQQQAAELPSYYAGMDTADAEEAGMSDNSSADKGKGISTGISALDEILAHASGQQLRVWANGADRKIANRAMVTDPAVADDVVNNLFGDPTKRYSPQEITQLSGLSWKDKLHFAQLAEKDYKSILRPYFNKIDTDYKEIPTKDPFALSTEKILFKRQLLDAYADNPTLDIPKWMDTHHLPIMEEVIKKRVAKQAESAWVWPWDKQAIWWGQKDTANAATPPSSMDAQGAGGAITEEPTVPIDKGIDYRHDLKPGATVPQYTEGMTAINRQTGQRMIYEGGKWNPLELTPDKAREFLQASGGDKDKARDLARRKGYRF